MFLNIFFKNSILSSQITYFYYTPSAFFRGFRGIMGELLWEVVAVINQYIF
jgi:hypothetical protein